MKNQIYSYMATQQARHDRWKTRKIANEFNLDIYQARNYLLQLCEEGRVVKTRTGRGAPIYWSLAPDDNNLDSQNVNTWR